MWFMSLKLKSIEDKKSNMDWDPTPLTSLLRLGFDGPDIHQTLISAFIC